jgi:hypothetical protein
VDALWGTKPLAQGADLRSTTTIFTEAPPRRYAPPLPFTSMLVLTGAFDVPFHAPKP